MISKTPQFDKALNEILDNLKPHKRVCNECKMNFEIFKEDIDFYYKLRVPPQTLCPNCRFQRILGYRVFYLPIFYKRKCYAPNHNEEIISYYSKYNKVKVYDDTYYSSQKWDAMEFLQEYNFNKSFFEQFKEFSFKVPHQSLRKDSNSVNSDYVVGGISAKNCYYVSIPYNSENIYYGSLPIYSRDSIDVFYIHNVEYSYSSFKLYNSYNCDFSSYSENCIDSNFLYDCRNCSNCFGCFNLRNKQYCFFNKQLSKEEYLKKMKVINLGKRTVVKEYKEKFEKFKFKAIRKCVNNTKIENSIGNDLRMCKNCFYCFDLINNCEDLRYVRDSDNGKDSMDVFGLVKSSFVYESTSAISVSNVKFSIIVKEGLEVEYSSELRNCEYMFGCFGLKNKKYCIFNKQYSEDEYFKMIDKIKTQMLKQGEYGEFFPLKDSFFPYNDTAFIEFPLTKEEVLKKGWYWQDDVKSDLDLSKLDIIEAKDMPNDIADVDESILKKAIICEKTKKPFKITKFELDFYRKKNIPLPTVHPLERIKELVFKKEPFILLHRKCQCAGKESDNKIYENTIEHFHKNDHCPNEFQTVYAPDKPEIVYCEKCYLAEVV
ncbi:MAG: hypothetical protein AAB593_00205 [Patescibacteria group bacterium]